MMFIGSLRERFAVVSLTGGEYAEALAQAATLGIQGGTVYDLLLSACALKAESKAIYTSKSGATRFGDPRRRPVPKHPEPSKTPCPP